MKLGEMLIRDGRLSDEQINMAVAQQGRDGGRFGTILAEMGLLDLDTLTVYLGLELGVPIATGAALERVKKTAVRLLTPQQAVLFRCIPIVIQHRQLVAAIDDPHDLKALDELSKITSYRVVPRVAPEIRIYYYLERYYGVPRPKRFAAFGESARGSKRAPDPALPAPPLPGLPPASDSPIAAPTPPPILHATVVDDSGEEPLELTDQDLVEILDADDDAVAEQAEKTEVAKGEGPAPKKAARVYEPLSYDEALAKAEGAQSRSDIGDALLGYCAGTFQLATLMTVRDNLAFGWKAFGPSIDENRVDVMLIPLDQPSIFQMANHAGHLYQGPPFPSTVHNYLFRALGCAAPSWSVVVAVTISKRVVNMLYAHRDGDDPISQDDLEQLKSLADACGNAYVQLIQSRKKRSATEDGASDAG
jgi:hypothetical protein